MTITLCDACGKQYKKYEDTPEGHSGNGMSIYKKGKQGKLEPIIKLDLCPKCMETVYSFLTEDLVQPESLRYAEVCGVADGTIEDEEGEIGVLAASSDEEGSEENE